MLAARLAALRHRALPVAVVVCLGFGPWAVAADDPPAVDEPPAADGVSSSPSEPDLPPELATPGADLRAAGQRYLDAGDLGPAVEVLTAAAERNPRDSRAQLLAALALSRILVERREQRCDWDAWPDRIEAHLQAAWALDRSVIDRVESAPELAPIRAALANSLSLRLWPSRGRAWEPTGPPKAVVLAGMPVMRLEGIVKKRRAERILTEITWYGVDPDGEHDGTVLDLRAGGLAIRATLTEDADGTLHPTWTQGSWTADKEGVHLVLAGEHRDQLLTLQGLQVGTGKEAVVQFIDRPPDCGPDVDPWAGLPDGLK